MIPSAGPGADPSVQAVSPQVTVSHPPGGRLPLLSARPVVTFPAAEQHRPSVGTKLYCLATEAHRCEQLAQSCYAALPRVEFEPATYRSQVQRSTRCTAPPPHHPLTSTKLHRLVTRDKQRCQQLLSLRPDLNQNLLMSSSFSSDVYPTSLQLVHCTVAKDINYHRATVLSTACSKL